MIEPKQYKVRDGITERDFLFNGFLNRSDYYKFRKPLYGNTIYLNIFIDKDDHHMRVDVQDDNGYTYHPFYNPETRHNNKVYNKIVKEYNNFMDKLKNKGILEYEEGTLIDKKDTIKIKRLNKDAKIPTRGSKYAAGYDLYANCNKEVCVYPHTTSLIGTGVAAEIPEGFFGAIFARSGLATKQGLRPANCVGVVDSDYRGEIKVALHNDSNGTKKVACGDRIAQLVIMPYLSIEFEEVTELNDTERGSGGFGSTGSK